MHEEHLEKAISAAIRAGYQVDKATFDFMSTLPNIVDPQELMMSVIRQMEDLPEKPMFVDSVLLKSEAEKRLREFESERPKFAEPSSTEEGKAALFQPYAKEVNSDLKVIEDPTHNIQSGATLQDYTDYFRDRFRRVSRLLRQRLDVREATSIPEALKSSNKRKTKIICIVMEKRESKRGIFLSVEDLEATATVYIPLNGKNPAANKVRSVPLDQVICIDVVKAKNNLLVAEDLLLPDLPNRKPNKAPVAAHAALISDLHIGSKMFMEKELRRFILWLKGDFGDEKARLLAGHVKYIIIAGDVVDGVGIYPQQIDELVIKDIYKQYSAAAAILQDIPDYIDIVIIPGNHDGTRRALPQPAIQRKYAEPLYEAREIFSVGNPSVVSFNGVNILITHGTGLDDIIASLPGMSFQDPSKAMTLLLQCRHLAPTYGQRTPLAADKRDFLVIDNLPDVFHAGHIHTMKYGLYRGTVVVNSGAWQRQTEYQKELGHIPNPGIVPIVNLETLEVIPVDFRGS